MSENRNKSCPCYSCTLDMTDGCEYEFCCLYCDTEFDCSMCEHTDMEKHICCENMELRNDVLQNQIDRNQINRLEKENNELLKEIKELREKVEMQDKLIEQREQNVADFAVNNSKYVQDIRRKI